MSALAPLLLALAACSGSGGEPSAESTAPPPAPALSPIPPPSALFVLGDSLSDVGNAAAAADYVLNVPIDPPTVGLCNPIEVLALKRRCDDLFYRQSRVTDGPVAVEYLAEHFGLATLRPSLHLLPSQSRAPRRSAYPTRISPARSTGSWSTTHRCRRMRST
jgi:hypothetical protein